MTTPELGCSFQAIAVSGIDRKDDGKNGHESEYAVVWRLVMGNYQTFSPELFLSLTRSLDLDQQEVKSLTKKYINRALKSGHIVQIDSCMDSPVYKIV